MTRLPNHDPGVLAARRSAAAADLRRIVRDAVFDVLFDAEMALPGERLGPAGRADAAAEAALRVLSREDGAAALHELAMAGGLP